jgi:RimJ/RimL family protein N-acetyltransferase
MVLQTDRLILREFHRGDDAFVLRLLNEPSFKAYIGDKGVTTIDQAIGYLQSGPMASYARYGFGLWCMALHSGAQAIGMCGLLKRDYLDHVDLGYALLEQHCGQGYALEAAQAVVDYAGQTLGLCRVEAIVTRTNARSIRLLEKVGMHHDRRMQLPNDGADVELFAIQLD